MAAAKALIENTSFDAKTIVEKAMDITSRICIYTNRQFTVEVL